MAGPTERARVIRYDGTEILKGIDHTQRGPAPEVACDFETGGYLPGTHKPPDYALINVGHGNRVIHQCSFLYGGPVFSLHDPGNLESPKPDVAEDCKG